jgi:hypothetical protein
MRLTTRVDRIPLDDDGAVLLAERNSAAEELLLLVGTQEPSRPGDEMYHARLAARMVGRFDDLVDTGAFVGWEGVTDADDRPIEFDAQLLKRALDATLKAIVFGELFGLWLEDADDVAAAVEAEAEDPTRSRPVPMSRTG